MGSEMCIRDSKIISFTQGKPTLLGSQTLHFAPHFTTLWTKISFRTAFETYLLLRVSVGALVKTIAGAVPEAQFRPMAHSMRPHLSNISRFQSIAVVQPRAKGLYEHFSVSERLGGIVCQLQTMELSVCLKENQWLALRSGQR